VVLSRAGTRIAGAHNHARTTTREHAVPSAVEAQVRARRAIGGICDGSTLGFHRRPSLAPRPAPLKAVAPVALGQLLHRQPGTVTVDSFTDNLGPLPGSFTDNLGPSP
jgi:hypothetical protein